MLFVALIILAGRVAIATQAVDSAATAAARTASIARTAGAADATARTAAAASLAEQSLQCVSSSVTVDTTGFGPRPVPPPRSPRPCGAWSTWPTWPCPGCPAPGPSPRARPPRSTPSGRDDPRPHPAPTRHGAERGSISIWLVTTGFAMIVLVGLAVDLGGQVHAQQHARAVADQAARTGGQQLQPGPAMRGETAIADTPRAVKPPAPT